MITEEFLKGRRFAVRFLGRPHAWVWLGVVGTLACVAWVLVAVPGRGAIGFQRSWFLWSGNVLLAMFVTTLLFSVRKWSIKLGWFRNLGRVPPERVESCWGEIQRINHDVRRGSVYGDDGEIMEAAGKALERFGVQKVQRVHLVTRELPGGRRAKYVAMSKRDPLGRLEPWLEMHMGLGTVALVGVILHADFALRHPIGWTLFIGSVIVLVTGVIGAYLYRVVPTALAGADAGIPYEEAGVARESYQASLEGVMRTLDDEFRAELAPLERPCGSPAQFRERSREVLSKVAQTREEKELELARDLVVMAGSRDHLLWNTARARRLDFVLKLWKWIHVPVSVALLFVIVQHVIAVLWF